MQLIARPSWQACKVATGCLGVAAGTEVLSPIHPQQASKLPKIASCAWLGLLTSTCSCLDVTLQKLPLTASTHRVIEPTARTQVFCSARTCSPSSHFLATLEAISRGGI